MSEAASASYSPGLKDVIADESSICQVDPNAGLTYRGYDADELAKQAGFDEVAWLILHGELPAKAELAQFEKDLAVAQTLPPPVLEMLRLLPKNAHPIDALRTGVSMLGMFDPDEHDNSHDANLRKATRLLAQVTALTTSTWRIAQGHKPVAASDEVSLCGRFIQCLIDRPPEPWQIQAFNIIFILYAEHEFNASTFAARVTASTLADMHAAVTSALGALKGPLHGGANEEAMQVLRDVGTPDRADAWVSERLAKKEKISGFGHRVYRTGDSRVPAMRELARQLAKRFGHEKMVAVCEELESIMSRRKNLCANLDLYAAPVLHLLGIPAVLNTPIFACARVSGWCAHIIEQHDHNRIIRPRCLYNGSAHRKYPGAKV